jgi:hypothetical protein
MITISTRDYTTEQLRDLEAGLFCAANLIFDSPECQKYADCTTACKAFAICHDIANTRQYLWKKIREREALELHRDTQESE